MANHLRITIVGDAGVGKSTVGFVSELNVDGIQYSLEFIEGTSRLSQTLTLMPWIALGYVYQSE